MLSKSVELRRHHAADGDVLSAEGIRTALETGGHLEGEYEILVSSGAQRATQTLACYLAASGMKVTGGVLVDERFRSEVEDRWKAAYEAAGAGDLESFKRSDPGLIEDESARFKGALEDLFRKLGDGGRALVVGHSPMLEVAVYALTGEIIPPLSKGAGVRVVASRDVYEVQPVGSVPV